MSARLQLEALRAEVPAAERRVNAADEERRRADRAVAAANAPLLAYQEAVGAGEIDPDPIHEGELRAAVREAQADVTWRLDGGVYRPVNEAAEAKLAGAQRALLKAQDAVDLFLRRRRDDLAGELAAAGRPIRDRYEEVRRDVLEVEQAWEALAGEWAPVMQALGIERRELPLSPVRGTQWRRPVEPLIPRPLQPEESRDRLAAEATR